MRTNAKHVPQAQMASGMDMFVLQFVQRKSACVRSRKKESSWPGRSRVTGNPPQAGGSKSKTPKRARSPKRTKRTQRSHSKNMCRATRKGRKGLVTPAPACSAEPWGLYPTTSSHPEKVSLGNTGNTGCGSNDGQATNAAVPADATSIIGSVLEWNCHSLKGSKLLAVMTKIHDLKPDAIVLTVQNLRLVTSPICRAIFHFSQESLRVVLLEQ